MNRRTFLQAMFGTGAVLAAPKIFIDMGRAWQRRESGIVQLDNRVWWKSRKFNAEEGELTASDITGLFQKAYGPMSENLYFDGTLHLFSIPATPLGRIVVPAV